MLHGSESACYSRNFLERTVKVLVTMLCRINRTAIEAVYRETGAHSTHESLKYSTQSRSTAQVKSDTLVRCNRGKAKNPPHTSPEHE